MLFFLCRTSQIKANTRLTLMLPKNIVFSDKMIHNVPQNIFTSWIGLQSDPVPDYLVNNWHLIQELNPSWNFIVFRDDMIDDFFLTSMKMTFHVVSAHWDEDLEWLKKTGMSYSVCDKLLNPNYQGTGDCDVPQNTGNECSAYLQYIINKYDDLTDKVAFIHGHEEAWHQKKRMSETLIDADNTNVNFATLNGTFIQDDAWAKAVPVFKEKFPKFSQHEEWMSKIDTSSNFVKADCCAQFVVDKHTIHRLPKEAWQTLQNEVLQSDSRSDQCLVLERMWAPIFGQPADDSHAPQRYVSHTT